MTEATSREDVLAAEMVRRNLVDAAERASKCLEVANVGLQRLSREQYELYYKARAALNLLLLDLKFGQ